MAYPLQKQTALITGGSNGIGFAIAEKFIENGIKVTIADIVPPSLTFTGLTYRYCDVTNNKDVDSLFAGMQSCLPDILVLNAGKGIHERLTEGDPEKWAAVVNLNIMGILRCIRAFVPPMQKNQTGKVVFISSVAAKKPYAYGGVYAASKAAVDSIAETLRIETMPFIGVTTIVAGITNTGFFSNRPDKDLLMQQAGFMQPQDIAEDVYYAISKPAGSSINSIMARPSGQEF